MKAIVNNNEKNQVQKKYKNNKSFKGKNEGTFYPKPNSYGKKQYVNNNKEPDSFTNTNFNYANNNLNNSYANKIGKGYSNNQYNSESNSFSKPTFSNVNMKINSIIKVESDQITQSSEKTNQPPSFINSSINLNDKSSSPIENPTNNELFSTAKSQKIILTYQILKSPTQIQIFQILIQIIRKIIKIQHLQRRNTKTIFLMRGLSKTRTLIQ